MDPDIGSPSTSTVKCCDCGCNCSSFRSFSGTWLRSTKRKFDEFEVQDNNILVPGFSARIEIENECVALREMVTGQQQSIQDLYVELEEERNASSTAANEAMSMILRLQREKAEIQMELRQFKRFSEEKMAHDQLELLALEDLLYKREQTIQSLTCEVQAYKHRMLSYGFSESEADGERGTMSRNSSAVGAMSQNNSITDNVDERSMRGTMSRNNSMADNLDSQFEFPTYDYPPLKCNLKETQAYAESEPEDVEKYAFGETPRSLKDIEHRINQLERSPRHILPDGEFLGTKSVPEKVIVGQSPGKIRHFRRFSADSTGSLFGASKETGSDVATDFPKFGASIRKECSQMAEESNLEKAVNLSDAGDEMSDRVYTIDSVYNGVAESKTCVQIGDDYEITPSDSMNYADIGDPEIKKLYMRLQALEADRESMRQTLISMRTDKAQLVLLKEIAQHLCIEMSPEARMPVKKPTPVGRFSFVSMLKWIVSFVFWRKRAQRSKYSFGMSANNAGLLMLLEKGPRLGQWRCLSRSQM